MMKFRSHAREFHERISEEKNVQSSLKKELKSLVLDTHSTAHSQRESRLRWRREGKKE